MHRLAIPANLFLSCPSPSLPHSPMHPSFHLVSYFCAWLFTTLISILSVSYFCANHLTLPSSNPSASYFWIDHFTLHPSIRLASYFLAVHLTLHPSIHLTSYFRAECLTFYRSIRSASYFLSFSSIHWYGEWYFVMNSPQIHLGTCSHALDDSWDWRESKFVSLNQSSNLHKNNSPK